MGTLLAIKRILRKGYPIDRYKCPGCGPPYIEKEPEVGIIIIVNLLS